MTYNNDGPIYSILSNKSDYPDADGMGRCRCENGAGGTVGCGGYIESCNGPSNPPGYLPGNCNDLCIEAESTVAWCVDCKPWSNACSSCSP